MMVEFDSMDRKVRKETKNKLYISTVQNIVMCEIGIEIGLSTTHLQKI